jgi:uncharacterized RDD family membrane protein YckC
LLTETTYAGVPSRFLAIVLDVALLSAVFFPVTRIVKGTWVMYPVDHRWACGRFVTDPLCLVFLLAVFLYFVLLEGSIGATFGKLLMGLKVVRADGGRAGVRSALVRNTLRVVDGLPAAGILGAILSASSDDRTRFGDRVARTRAVGARFPGSLPGGGDR